MSPADSNSWILVSVPESDLAELLMEFAAPLLDRLGEERTNEEVRAGIECAIDFWNASVHASERWQVPNKKPLEALKRRLTGKKASKADAALFALLTERWQGHSTEPRLVESWSLEFLRNPDRSASGPERFLPRLSCTMGLPPGYRPKVFPAADKRIAIDGQYLDEVQMATMPFEAKISVGFPCESHRGFVHEDHTVTIHTMMATVVRLFATGRLGPIGGDPVAVTIGQNRLGPMVLADVRSDGVKTLHEGAALRFRPIDSAGAIALKAGEGLRLTPNRERGSADRRPASTPQP